MIESLLYTLALCLPCVVAAVFSDKYQKEREKNRELIEELEKERRASKKFEIMLDQTLCFLEKNWGAK